MSFWWRSSLVISRWIVTRLRWLKGGRWVYYEVCLYFTWLKAILIYHFWRKRIILSFFDQTIHHLEVVCPISVTFAARHAVRVRCGKMKSMPWRRGEKGHRHRTQKRRERRKRPQQVKQIYVGLYFSWFIIDTVGRFWVCLSSVLRLALCSCSGTR